MSPNGPKVGCPSAATTMMKSCSRCARIAGRTKVASLSKKSAQSIRHDRRGSRGGDTEEEGVMSEEWAPFDARNTAMLTAVGFSITDEPGHGETASVEGE